MKPTLPMAGALAGAFLSLFSTNPANAAGCTFGGHIDPLGVMPVCTPASGPKYSTQLGDKLFTIITEPTTGSGDVEWTINPTATEWQTDVDWLGFGLAGLSNGLFEYTVQINTGSNQFASIDLDVAGSHLNPSTTVEKTVYDGLNDSGQLLATLSSVNGTDITNVPISGTQIFVRDVYSVPQGNTLDNMGNYIRQDVPGPLPLLGAAAALGFSRRLRRRLVVTG